MCRSPQNYENLIFRSTEGNKIATHDSIEKAGRFLGLTTGTAVGIALRNKSLCQGYLFRYEGVSSQDMHKSKKVTKICCDTGKRFFLILLKMHRLMLIYPNQVLEIESIQTFILMDFIGFGHENDQSS